MPKIRIGHSPDADDAFMYYAIAHGKVPVGEYQVQHVLEDIQTLNNRALVGELEGTAISAGRNGQAPLRPGRGRGRSAGARGRGQSASPTAAAARELGAEILGVPASQVLPLCRPVR